MKIFDYSKFKNLSWDNEILGLVAQIHEHKGKQEYYMTQKSDSIDKLIEIAIVQSTEASNAIEGIRTTSTRIKQLCFEKTTPKNRDEREILGYRDVLNTIHKNYEYIPLTSNYILQLHRDLYKYSEKGIGGKYKSTQNYITSTGIDGNSHVLFTPLAPYETQPAIEKICEEYNNIVDNREINTLILIPIFIHDFLCIHPFSDGNGRMSRLLTTLLLYKQGYFVGKYISIESKIAKNKDLYYKSLSECQDGWHENKEDKSAFIKYILGIILSSYRELDERINLIEKNLAPLQMVEKAVKLKIGKFTKSEIMEICPSISRASVEKALKSLVEKGEITRHGGGRSTYYINKL